MNNERSYRPTDWLPTSKKEVEQRGWDQLDVILFSGDAYVDHPSFGAAVIGRAIEKHGLKVAIVPQPNWRDDLRDFKKLGTPRLFFAISGGAMDSMINHYTANKRLRSDDAYTPDGRAGMRPDRATIVYTQILKQLYPDVPVVIGGIEASLRRITHYDYWDDCLRKTIVADSGADLLIYGMGEKPLAEIIAGMQSGKTLDQLRNIRQTAFLTAKNDIPQNIFDEEVQLFSHEECLRDKLKQARNFRTVEEESNRMHAARIIQNVDNKALVVNPPFEPMTEQEADACYDMPYTRLPHPRYKSKTIPAFEMIRFSVTMHRGCFGGCAFCTISAHQGKFVSSRSKQSIISEVESIVRMPDFKGYISDLGGPSANMYKMQGKRSEVCAKCKRPSCIHPRICPNLDTDHSALTDLYRSVDALPGIKKSFVGSGVRYDLILRSDGDKQTARAAQEYGEELIAKHVSGRLKVAPEHTSSRTLDLMRKPTFDLFHRFRSMFDSVNRKYGLNQQLIPYFISSHPGCSELDMAELAATTKQLHFKLEQVQDFTPSPMTLATEIYYTGVHPYTLERIYTARTKEQKNAQRKYFFWYDPQYKKSIISSLKAHKRIDLIKKLYPKG